MKRKTETPASGATTIGDSNKKRRMRVRNRVKQPKIVEKKQVKLIVNLDRVSQNWKSIIPNLPPKAAFKRQSLKKNPVQKKEPEVKPETKNKEIWFDVDKAFLPDAEASTTEIVQVTDEFSSQKEVKITKAVAIDCEMVGVGENGKDSILARVSLVNSAGECFYDKYVRPTEKVSDYRTAVSGVRVDDLKTENGAIELSVAQAEVAKYLENKILVGHALHNDLKVLFLSHPKKYIRDTQKCKVFRRMHKSIGSLTSLKNLSKLLLGLNIQEGEHSSVKDAQVTMRLYTTFKKEWEAELHNRSVKANEEKATEKTNESAAFIKDGLYKKESEIKILTGNDNHKRYLQNKLRKRNGKNKKKFLK